MSPMSPDVLTDPAYTIPPVPEAPPGGVAWLRANVARFSSGAAHERRRALVVAELAGLDPQELGRRAAEGGGGPVEVLAGALGLAKEEETLARIAADVALVAASYQPHTVITEEADRALVRLVEVCGGAADEATAARIGLLVQACDSTKALVANLLAGRTAPAVPVTRRIAPDGTLVEVDLAEAPFGLGPHACPGSAHALAIAAGLTQSLTQAQVRTK